MNIELIVPLIGLVAGFVGNFASGTHSLIALSSLLALGIPAHLSISIHRFGGLGFMSGGFLRYLRNNHIVWKYVVPITILSVVGVGIGTKIVLEINENLLTKIMSIAILLFIPLTLWKKELGVVKIIVSKTRERLGYFIYFILKVWSGIFPFGAGILLAYNYFYFFGMTVLDMRGTSRIPGFVGALTASAIFIASGVVDWKLGLIFLIANFIGSYLGAHYTIKTGNKILQYLIIISIVFLVLKTLFF